MIINIDVRAAASESAAIITNGQLIRFRERRVDESLNQFRRRVIGEAQSIASSRVILGGMPMDDREEPAT
jgi:hypothetical protein